MYVLDVLREADQVEPDAYTFATLISICERSGHTHMAPGYVCGCVGVGVGVYACIHTHTHPHTHTHNHTHHTSHTHTHTHTQVQR
jgi:hypothetical protein